MLKNPVVKKEELRDILYKKNIEGNMTMTQLITKDDISNIIDTNIELDDKNNGIECFEELLKKELMKKVPNYGDVMRLLRDFYFNKTYYFKIDDNKYIYFYLEQGKEKDFIRQIDYILDNNLNEGKNDNFLKHLRFQYVKQLEFYKALNNNKSIDDKFKEYDYIKVICENFYYNDIDIRDIAKCREFLNYHEKEHKYLTIEEQILLRLIILYGIKNIYLNNYDYYKKTDNEIIDYAMKNINDYILFIKENMVNIKNEYKYSFNCEYRINILRDISPIFFPNKEWWEIPGYKHTDKKGNIPFIFLLRYINFDYYVSNIEFEANKFEEAIKKFENAIEVKKLEEQIKIFEAYKFKEATEQFKVAIKKFENAIEVKELKDKKFEEIKNIFEEAKKSFKANEFEKAIKQFKETIKIFENAIEVKNFEEAKKIYEMNLPLFSFFKEESENSKEKEFMIVKLLSDINTESLLLLGNDYSYDVIDKIYIDPLVKRNIKVMLKFYISCYYYFKHFEDNENANKVYEFLLYFRKGYDIDDFIIKCKYVKMAEDICGDKLKDKDINDIKKIDEAVKSIENKISAMKIIDKFDIDDVKESYPHIKFDNFADSDKIKTYIATGDKIINTFYNDKNTKFDYSSAVIEWSKAVELGINDKFISRLANHKNDIEAEAKKRNPWKKDKPFRLNTKNATIGIYKAISDYNLQEYLYKEYFKKWYTFNENTYNDLCKYIIEISETRNDSAHKGKTINADTADTCKAKILNANRILEILSKLEKRC